MNTTQSNIGSGMNKIGYRDEATNQCADSVPPHQVQTQFELLAREIADNREIIGLIGGRLQSVTPSRPPSCAGESKSAPEEYLVPLASELRNL